MTGPLTPLERDRESARALARAAVSARSPSVEEARGFASEMERRIETATIAGRLWWNDGRAIGIALWEPPEPLGLTVRFCYIAPEHASPELYRSFFEALTRGVGPIAFVWSVGDLSREVEERVMTSLDFAPVHRTEMRFPPAAPLPAPVATPGVSFRPMRPTDANAVAAVHAAAYRGRFDRYLFLEDADPRADAEKFLSTVLAGRWGEFLAGPSFLAEASGSVVGATIVVRSEGRALIADVAVDPAAQGRGVGRALLVATLAALRARREPTIALAVTEENARARRLYERVGFVRALGPQRLWYHTRVVPVAPGPD